MKLGNVGKVTVRLWPSEWQRVQAALAPLGDDERALYDVIARSIVQHAKHLRAKRKRTRQGEAVARANKARARKVYNVE